MKKLLLLSSCFVTILANAQSLQLQAGKIITATTSSDMNMDMGMAGQMKIKGVSTSVINITVSEEKTYKATTTNTKMTLEQEGMGQSTKFDSEKKEDLDSEVGKSLSKTLKIPVEIKIDKNTGKATETNPAKEDDANKNPLADIAGGGTGSSASGVAESAFLIIPAGKKAGDKWIDSLNENGIKTIKNYELKSISPTEATVLLHMVSNGTINKEVQGSQMEINMNTIGESVITTDPNSGTVKKNTTENNMTGTLGIMGQSLPISMKMKAVSVFE